MAARGYVTMDVSARTYAEIRAKMIAAGFDDAIHTDGTMECIHVHGLVSPLPAPPACGELLVGVTERGDEVVINHPDLLTDENGVGHITFSAEQARRLAHSLLKHAYTAEFHDLQIRLGKNL